MTRVTSIAVVTDSVIGRTLSIASAVVGGVSSRIAMSALAGVRPYAVMLLSVCGVALSLHTSASRAATSTEVGLHHRHVSGAQSGSNGLVTTVTVPSAAVSAT